LDRKLIRFHPRHVVKKCNIFGFFGIYFFVESIGAGTSESSVPLQDFSSSFKILMVSASLAEEYAELGTSGEHRKEPGTL